MSKQEVSVRISQAGGKRDDARNDHGKHYSGRQSPAGGRLAVGKSKKAGREYKSPSKKSSAYSGAYDVFTITAYLPGQDSGDVEKRLKVRGFLSCLEHMWVIMTCCCVVCVLLRACQFVLCCLRGCITLYLKEQKCR